MNYLLNSCLIIHLFLCKKKNNSISVHAYSPVPATNNYLQEREAFELLNFCLRIFVVRIFFSVSCFLKLHCVCLQNSFSFERSFYFVLKLSSD